MLEEFKKFAMRGNVVDMAVGIVIGAAFGRIVSSFVNDILMPPIGMLMGGVDFSEFVITLKAASEGSEAVTLGYAMFINTLLDFLIVAVAIFIVIKAMNALQKKKVEAPTPPPELSDEAKLLAEIRDTLKNRA